MSEQILLSGLPAFLSHFVSAVLLLALFVVIYIWMTPYHEIALIRNGNSAAAASLSGSMLGYCVALASAIANSVNLYDMLCWGAIAMVVQLAAYFVVRLILPHLASDIPDNKIASGIFLGAVSIGLGLLNAACMTY